ncbi:hypothetical protein PSHT_05830 [Puccinia striiformis]|uniref:Uncharacterized protein n=1 Tax=Puccinia striiformis TaxID=27350 RepID=A0A2S4W9K1_9BASI|nr:hypothetical protein PSHT_05830 [Puccinia striiformis]
MQIWKRPIVILIFIGGITLTCGAVKHSSSCVVSKLTAAPVDGVSQKICGEAGCTKTYYPEVKIYCGGCGVSELRRARHATTMTAPKNIVMFMLVFFTFLRLVSL